MGIQPPPGIIDEDIRSLIHLLNESPYIQTTNCCSGYRPGRAEWLGNGYISLSPLLDRIYCFNLLDYIRTRLDNHQAIELMEADYNGDKAPNYELYQRVQAEHLFASGVPILKLHARLAMTLYSSKLQRSESDIAWKLLWAAAQEFIGETIGKKIKEAKFISSDTSDSSVAEMIRQLPYRVSPEDSILRVLVIKMLGELPYILERPGESLNHIDAQMIVERDS